MLISKPNTLPATSYNPNHKTIDEMFQDSNDFGFSVSMTPGLKGRVTLVLDPLIIAKNIMGTFAKDSPIYRVAATLSANRKQTAHDFASALAEAIHTMLITRDERYSSSLNQRQKGTTLERLGLHVSQAHVSFLNVPLKVAYNIVDATSTNHPLYRIACNYIYDYNFTKTWQEELQLKANFMHALAKEINHPNFTLPEVEP